MALVEEASSWDARWLAKDEDNSIALVITESVGGYPRLGSGRKIGKMIRCRWSGWSCRAQYADPGLLAEVGENLIPMGAWRDRGRWRRVTGGPEHEETRRWFTEGSSALRS